ncbi:MAG: MBOAT family O-acyltransferase [Oscillospiraceae bacterium]
MVFSDLLFIYLFLPLCLLCYYITPNSTVRNGVLIIFSLLFYSFGEPVWVLLLVISSAVDYLNGLFIERHRGKKSAVLGVIVSLVFNLGVLVLFKYSGFIVTNINALTGLSLAVPKFSPPVGVSFYTFQTISYTVDVYRSKAPVQHSFFKFLLYVSMFFQLVAGPIVRYTDISEQLGKRQITAEDISAGFSRFALGLGKKVIIANCVGEAADLFLGFESLPSSVLSAWSGIILFTLQIYFDFSGYSDMAIGLGRMFGFKLTENFNYPYISRSATEFWRRWHISMGSFFRDYVYIPMGGNRRHQAVNLAVVWLLTGLWHGASWNFIIWGAYFGILVTAEKFFYGKYLEKLPRFFSHLYLLIAVIFGWAIFYFEDLHALGGCLTGMFGGGNIPLTDDITVSRLEGICFVIIAAVILSCPVFPFVRGKLEAAAEKSKGAAAVVTTAYDLLVIAVFLISSLLLVKQTTYNPFLYFRF